jgi:uncharacterized membrane protein YbhN (UPF0104 family)
LIKSFQYYVLIKGVRYADILNIVVWQNTISNFISNGAGVASYMTMFKTEQNVKLSRSGATFLIVKFGDLFAIGFYLIIASAAVWRQVPELHALTLLLIFGIFSGIGIFLIAVGQKEKFITAFSRFVLRLKLDRFSLTRHSLDWLRSLAAEDEKRIFSLLGKSLLVSLLYMSVSMIYTYTVVGIFALPIKVWESLYIAALMQLVSFVPIQVLGGLGVSELTMVYLYGLFGISQAEMSTISLGLRALFYVMNASIFLYLPLSSLLRKVKAKQGDSRAD